MGRRRADDRIWVRPITKRGVQRWQVCVVVDGELTTESYPTEAAAERQANILRADMTSGRLDAPATWEEALEAFERSRKQDGRRVETLAFYRRALRAVGRLLGEPDPFTLRAADGERFLAARLEEARPATARGEIEAVTIMQRWFVEHGWIPRATWEDVRRPEVVSSREPLRANELAAFLRAAERLTKDPAAATNALLAEGAPKSERRAADWERWLAAVWLFMHGLRTEEVHHLLVRDIDLIHGAVYIVDREGARVKTATSQRTIPIVSKRARAVLADTFRDRHGEERAFDTGRAKGAVSTQRRTAWFLRRVRITCEVAGIRRCSTHELRHTVATEAIRRGADMHSLQWLLGHADAKTTSRMYVHADAAVRALKASELVGDYLDELVAPNPILKVV